MKHVRVAATTLVVGAFAVAGCGSDEHSNERTSASATPSAKSYTIEIAAIGAPGDPYFNVIKNGAKQASRDLRVTVNYRETSKVDFTEQAKLIRGAIARKPDALIVTDHQPEVLNKPIKDAVDAGIPTMIMDAAGPNYRDTLRATGALGFVGQDEIEVGRRAGERLKEAGVHRVFCANQLVGNPPLDQRCNGLKAVFGSSMKVLPVDNDDRTKARNQIKAALTANPSFDGILALGNTSGEPAIAAVQESGKAASVKVATIDLTPKILAGITDGTVSFASDHQQYYEGYLPVMFLALRLRYGLNPPAFVPPGPGYVTKENAAQIIELSKRGLR
jgi:simple sugar transport system substrate-binding protein